MLTKSADLMAYWSLWALYVSYLAWKAAGKRPRSASVTARAAVVASGASYFPAYLGGPGMTFFC
jgi:hypothetical protein